jgi:hypothetical protein
LHLAAILLVIFSILTKHANGILSRALGILILMLLRLLADCVDFLAEAHAKEVAMGVLKWGA